MLRPRAGAEARTTPRRTATAARCWTRSAPAGGGAGLLRPRAGARSADLRSAEQPRRRASCARRPSAEALASLDRRWRCIRIIAEAYYNRAPMLADAQPARPRRWRVTRGRSRSSRISARRAGPPASATADPLRRRERDHGAPRAAYEAASARARCADYDAGRVPADMSQGPRRRQPFFLAYQGHNDRDLQRLFGALVCRIMADRYPAPPSLPSAARARRADPGRHRQRLFLRPFELEDPDQRLAQPVRPRPLPPVRLSHRLEARRRDRCRAPALATASSQGPLSIERWRATIAADPPHVLIYPEIGMDETACSLPRMRLAPVQCNSMGPSCTPAAFRRSTISLSSDLMEPPAAQIALHGKAGSAAQPLDPLRAAELPPVRCHARRARVCAPDATVYWCGQSLFKYLPQYDEVFPRIARRCSDCQFVFIAPSGRSVVTDLFRARLERAFAAAGLKAADHCVFLPA